MAGCAHMTQVREVVPRSEGCEGCLALGAPWTRLRMCRICGYVGCCDSTPGRHATQHFRDTGHPIMRSIEPDEDWSWCYVDALLIAPDPED